MTASVVPPIIVRVLGGLGNQLFQYAAGRRLALRTGAPLKLDLTDFATYPLRKYRLSHFRTIQNEASAEDLAAVPHTWLGRMVARRRAGTFRYVKEQRWCSKRDLISDLGSGVYLDGYWQGEGYFADIAHILRRELVPKHPVTKASLQIAQRMRETESVGLHVRRGDYVSHWRNRLRYKACSADYYRKAVAEITQRRGRCDIFVFSDDHAWVREHLGDSTWSQINHNGPDRDYEDLWLMSQCRHHIIANSTFSWWAAWLGANPHQVVVAPRNWFVNSFRQAPDLYPMHWLRL